MNRISGKIIVKESGLGIPDLLVSIYDLDPNTQSEEMISATAAATVPANTGEIKGDRLGSVLTDREGKFELTYEDSEFQKRNIEKRPDLMLIVGTAEEPSAAPKVLFVSTMVRQNAGRIEQYLIRFTSEQLDKNGVPLPTTPADEIEDPNSVVARLLAADARLETVEDGMRAIDKKRVKRIRQTAGNFHTKLKPSIRKMLSRVPETLLNPESFVAPGESVFEKAKNIIRKGIERVINSNDPKVHAPITGFIALTAEQKQALASRLGADGAIKSEALDEILGRDTNSSATTYLVHEDPFNEVCRKKTSDEAECASALGVGAGESGSTPAGEGAPSGEARDRDVAGTGVTAITEQDINRYVAQLMDKMTSPEERVLSGLDPGENTLSGLEPRADQTTVGENIENLSFPPSPADVPAYYDFHSLQIAFEHVWQEAIDEGILNLAQDAYHDIVELGGDPDANGDATVQNPIHSLQHEGRVVLTSRRIVRDHRSEVIVRDHRGEVTVRDHRGEPIIRDHRGGQAVTVPSRPGKPRPGSVTVPDHPADRLPETLSELEQRLKEDYAFTIYAANRKERSVNFGMLVTYRQKWEPVSYQAGKLAKTITLAPKETQKYSKKTVIRRKRAEKEVENHLSTRHEENSQTSRAEQEIVRKASTDTNFSMTSQGTVNVPLGSATIGGSVTTVFERKANKASEDVKKGFHEAVFKAAQDYKDERTVEVNTEESEETEITESGEITNPNDELAVTFLFYELQRRYRVNERIHRLTPVIFVAQEMPRPDEIDEAWLLSHDWILRRVLLDDSFVPAMNYLSQNVVGEQVALEEMRENIDQQRKIVEELRAELGVARNQVATYRTLLDKSLLQKAANKKGGGGLIPGIPDPGDLVELGEQTVEFVGDAVGAVSDFLFGSDAPAGQNRQDALKEAMQRAADEERDLLFRLEREVTALNALTETYSKALAEHLNHKAQVARLRMHIKQNILYYMQAIWSHEPPDQRFFRLHNVQVPVLESADTTYYFNNLDPVRSTFAAPAHIRLPLNGKKPVDLYGFKLKQGIKPEPEFTTLAQVANLDSLLGFKGNYMIFSLKESNVLTDYMMAPYILAGFDQLVDPDDLGNCTLEEFAKYVCSLKETLSSEEFEEIKDQLVEQYEKLLTAPQRNGDIITVPTNSLFIEALPASHSLIEEFKARHRAVDVKKVQAEVRKAELENIRAAARILGNKLEDPDIESVKHVYVQNPPGINIGDE